MSEQQCDQAQTREEQGGQVADKQGAGLPGTDNQGAGSPAAEKGATKATRCYLPLNLFPEASAIWLVLLWRVTYGENSCIYVRHRILHEVLN